MKAGKAQNGEALRAAQRSTFNVQHLTSNDGVSEGGEFDLEERLLEFAARIIRLVDSLFSTKAGNHVGGQLLRSGTSPLPNHGEAQAAESIQDFIHKLKVCHKELIETRRWLRLVHRVPLIEKPKKVEPLIDETRQLILIFAKSLKTAKSRREAIESGSIQEQPEISDPWLLDPWMLNVECLTLNVEPPAGPSEFPSAIKIPKAPVKYGKERKKK